MMSILIVDEGYLMRYSLSSIFNNGEAEVTTTADGAAALDAINSGSFDLCLLNVQLPDMSGLDVMKKLRNVSPRTIIVIMTRNDLSKKTVKSIRDNAHCLISKSFDLLQVKSFVELPVKKDKPLSQDKSTVIKDQLSFITWLADDVRRHIRKPIVDNISCWTVSPKSDKLAFLTADVLDVSEMGMCIMTNYNSNQDTS